MMAGLVAAVLQRTGSQERMEGLQCAERNHQLVHLTEPSFKNVGKETS